MHPLLLGLYLYLYQTTYGLTYAEREVGGAHGGVLVEVPLVVQHQPAHHVACVTWQPPVGARQSIVITVSINHVSVR